MIGEVELHTAGLSFANDTGKYQIPYTFWIDHPYLLQEEFERHVVEAARERGLQVMFDFDIIEHVHVIRWRPDTATQ